MNTTCVQYKYKEISLDTIEKIMATVKANQSDRQFVVHIFGKNSLDGLKAFNDSLTTKLLEHGK